VVPTVWAAEITAAFWDVMACGVQVHWFLQLTWHSSCINTLQQPIIHSLLFCCSLSCKILHKSLKVTTLCFKACLALWKDSSKHTMKLLHMTSENLKLNVYLKLFQRVPSQTELATHTFSFNMPCKWKSQGFKSGDCEGQNPLLVNCLLKTHWMYPQNCLYDF
jgi:hypothetical protein